MASHVQLSWRLHCLTPPHTIGGDLSLCSAAPPGGAQQGSILHFSLLRHRSENQNQKTITLQTVAFLINYPLCLFPSHSHCCFSPRWSLSFPHPSVSCDTVFDTRTTFLWITSLDPLYPLLLIQLLAATDSLLLVVEICTHTKTEQHAVCVAHAEVASFEVPCWGEL